MRRRVRTAGGLLPRLGRTAIAVQAVVALAFAGGLLVAIDPTPGDGWTVTAELPEAGGLGRSDRARVVVAGVRAGSVEDVTVHGGRARLTLKLDDDVKGRIRRGARVSVRPRSALDDLEVALTPGAPGAPALRDGDRVDAATASRPVALDEVLATLDADTRAYVQVVAAELDAGLDGDRGGRLAAVLRQLRPTADAGARVSGILARRRTLLARLVGDLDRLLSVTARNGDSLGRAISAGRRVTDITGARRPELERAISELPATLTGLRGALADVDDLGEPLQPALERLRPAARELPGALRELERATPAARSLVTEVARLAAAGRTPAASLRRALASLPRAASGLESPVRRARTVVEEIDRNRDGVGLLGERFTGIFSTNDVNGVILRGLGFFEPFNPANFGFPGATGARRAKVAADVVRALVKVCREDNELACLVRYLVPGLPGAVRTAEDAIGLTKQPRGTR